MHSSYKICALVKGKHLQTNTAKVNSAVLFKTNYPRSDIKSIVWKIDHNKTNSLQVSHVFTTSGTKNIKCTINNCCVLRKEIYISPLPVTAEPEQEQPSENEIIPPNAIILNYINNSSNANIDVVILQKNIAVNFEETAIAWKVLSFSNVGENIEVIYNPELEIAMADQFGNYSPKLDAEAGQKFSATSSPSGDILSLTGSSTSPQEIELINSLISGSINGLIYRGDCLLSEKTINPSQTAVFEFRPTFFTGVVSSITQGQEMDSTILSQINTEISMLGIRSADVIITGGGVGPSATPIQFSLSNVVFS